MVLSVVTRTANCEPLQAVGLEVVEEVGAIEVEGGKVGGATVVVEEVDRRVRPLEHPAATRTIRPRARRGFIPAEPTPGPGPKAVSSWWCAGAP